jgi:polyisoprenoid-binding protein YceI
MSTAAPGALAYNIDSAHSGVHFKVRHLMISSVRGEFTKISGSVTYVPGHPENSSFEATIDTNSISTREVDRDNHLKSPDFLDVANHPTMTFKSTKITPTGPDSYAVDGDLTIRGTTKPVTLKVEEVSEESKDPWGLMRRGATASATINRKDYGVAFNAVLETGGFMVGDDVHITIDVEVVRPAA